tara:strand:+ start:1096 stop:1266 length:171 start_codon:yes stop_codon:yes gene_type:complete
MVEVKEELIKEALDQLKAAQLDKYVQSTENVINELQEVINFARCYVLYSELINTKF